MSIRTFLKGNERNHPEFERHLAACKGARKLLEDFETRQARLKGQAKETQAKGVELSKALEAACKEKDAALIKFAAGEGDQAAVDAARAEVARLEGAVRENSEFLDATERAAFHGGVKPSEERSRLLAHAADARKVFYRCCFDQAAVEIRALLGDRLIGAYALAVLGDLRVHDVEEFARKLFDWQTPQARGGAFEDARKMAAELDKDFLG